MTCAEMDRIMRGHPIGWSLQDFFLKNSSDYIHTFTYKTRNINDKKSIMLRKCFFLQYVGCKISSYDVVIYKNSIQQESIIKVEGFLDIYSE